MKLAVQVGLGPGYNVLDGDSAPLPPKGHSPPIFGLYRYGQVAGSIKMPLGREVGLDPNNIVLDRDPAPLPQKGDRAPHFRPMSIV